MKTLPENENISKLEITRTINELIRALEIIDPVVSDRAGVAEPPASMKRRGKLAYADGVLWNPGSGEGLYRWGAGAWVKIG